MRSGTGSISTSSRARLERGRDAPAHARASTAKGLDVAVAAVPLAGADVELHFGPRSRTRSATAPSSRRSSASWSWTGGSTIGDSVPAPRSRLFADHDALVNNMRAGAPDKVVYEAAAACLPVLASNPIFDELLDPEQRFTRWDPALLAERIQALAR